MAYNSQDNRFSKVFVLFVIAVMGFFLLRDGLGLKLPIELIVAIYVIGLLLLQSEENIYFFIFLVPLSVGPLLYFLNVLFGLIFILKNLYKININQALIVGYILILWEGMHLLLNTFMGFNESLIKLLGFALVLCITILCISNEKLRPNFVKLTYSWCLGFGGLCGILMLKYIYLFGASDFTLVVRRFGWIPKMLEVSNTTLLINPNLVGRLSILSIFCLLNVLKFEEKHTKIIIFGILCFVIFGVLSVSRSFLLVVFLLVVIYSIEIILNFKSNSKMAILLFMVGIVLVIIATQQMEDTLEFWNRRLQSDNITGSRNVIYKNYVDALSNSFYFIFGSGMQDYIDKFNVINPNIIWSTHNVIIEIFVIWGIVGFVIVTKLFITLYKSLKINNSIIKRTFLPYLPLLGLFLSAQFGQFFISYYHSLPTLILGFISIKFADEKIGELRAEKTEIKNET